MIMKKKIWLKKVKEKQLMKLLGKMHKYKTMISYCLKCKRIQKAQTEEFQKLVIIKQWFIKVQEPNGVVQALKHR